MLINAGTGKDFEKPDSGLFLGVLADVVYVNNHTTRNGPKNIARLIWVLNAKDSEGNYYRVMTQANQSMHENARLYGIVKDIQMGTPPPVPFDPDTLIGTVRQLVITREKSEMIDQATGLPKEYANIKAYILPNPGQTFAVPANFVRAKDKPARAPYSSRTGAPAQTVATAPATSTAPAQAAPVVVVQDEDIPF